MLPANIVKLQVMEEVRSFDNNSELDPSQSTAVEAIDMKPSSVKSDSSIPDSKSEAAIGGEANVVLVGWEGSDDSGNPKTWQAKKKIVNVAIISAMTFLCPLCSAIFVSSPLIYFSFQVSWSSTNSNRLSHLSNAFGLFSLGISFWLRSGSAHSRTDE